jgi:acetolactate synthase regulatory subunit
MRRTGVVAAGLVLMIGLVAGCSASQDTSTSSSAQVGTANGAVQPNSGKAADSAPQAAANTTGRQVVTTGTVQVTVDDPRAAVDAVVALVESEGGRVDARSERAGTDSQTAHAQLTVRIPSDDMTATLTKLRGIGDVSQVQLSSQDVTADTQDLDARIKALTISVARLEDLLARATTNADLIAAEEALSQRQSNLESLQSQRARLAEQVALSTLQIDLSTPGAVPAATSPHGFWDGIVVGWQSLVAVLRVVVLVVGVLLPWLVFGGLATALVVALVRASRRRRAPTDGPPAEGSPMVGPPTLGPLGAWPAPAGPHPADPPVAGPPASGPPAA